MDSGVVEIIIRMVLTIAVLLYLAMCIATVAITVFVAGLFAQSGWAG